METGTDNTDQPSGTILLMAKGGQPQAGVIIALVNLRMVYRTFERDQKDNLCRT